MPSSSPLTPEQTALFNQHAPYVRAFARRYRWRLPEDDARQEALIALWEAVQIWTPGQEGNFRAFASRVVNCRLVDACRRWDVLGRRERQRVKDGLDPDVLFISTSGLFGPWREESEGFSRDLSPEQEIAGRELWQRCLSVLSSADQRVFLARFLRQRSLISVARIAGYRHQSTSARMRAVRSRLASILAQVRVVLREEAFWSREPDPGDDAALRELLGRG